MKTFLFSLGVFFVSVTLMGQNIYSGIWDDYDYYFDFRPDTILPEPQNYVVNNLEIDMNGDGTKDFRLTTLLRDEAQWSNRRRVTIEGLSQNQVAYSEIDTCWSHDFPPLFVHTSNTPLELGYNVLIDENLNWTDSIVWLSYNEWDATFPTNNGYHCSRVSQFYTDTGYIAVRLIEQNDIFYGWIKISTVHYSSCIIHDFACNLDSTSINILESDPCMMIYPNPANNLIYVEYSNLEDANVQIFNINGQEIYSEIAESNHMTIDLSGFKQGLYLLKVVTEDFTQTEKIIIE